MRHIIIHYHIFKNAGTTIDGILEKNFGTQCGYIEGANPWDTLESDLILKYAMDNPQLKSISSHQARLPIPVSQDISFHPILFLRHPIDRIGSVYYFERNQPVDSPSLGAKIARELGIVEYVKWRLEKGNGSVVKNFQTIYLAGRQHDMRSAVATDQDLQLAIERISLSPNFGVVEYFNESITRIGKYLSQYFGPVDMRYSIKNRSNERKAVVQARLDDMEAVLGRNLFTRLIDENDMDMQLYETSLRLFSRKAQGEW